MNGLQKVRLDYGRMPIEQPAFPIILAIDPSMNNLGYACYNCNLGENRYDIDSEAWRFGLIHPKAKQIKPPHFKWRNAYTKLRGSLADWKPTHFVSEWPSFFNSVKGKIAAQEGYTIDLAGMVGYIAGRFGMQAECVSLYKPQVWKGSVPKSVTKEKFLRLFGEGAGFVARHNSDDVIDAIMIAEFWLTLYHREKFSWTKG